MGLFDFQEGNILKAEVANASIIAVVSTPKQHSLQLKEDDTLVVTCVNGDVDIGIQGQKSVDKNRTNLITEVSPL